MVHSAPAKAPRSDECAGTIGSGRGPGRQWRPEWRRRTRRTGQRPHGGFREGRGASPRCARPRWYSIRTLSALLASILDRGQYGRLKQIQLQREGINALMRPDMIEKLNLDEFQVEKMRELHDQSRQAQRESGQAMFDMIRAGIPNPAKNGPNPGGGVPRGLDMRDPAVQVAMKNFMAKPEVRAKMGEMHAQSTKIQDQLLAMVVNRVFGKRQPPSTRRCWVRRWTSHRPAAVRGKGPLTAPLARISRIEPTPPARPRHPVQTMTRTPRRPIRPPNPRVQTRTQRPSGRACGNCAGG